MKLITIPDLHGKDYWKSIDPELYDKIIFLGDYVDSKKQYSNAQELANLEAIIQFKLSFPGKVIMLLGNHDIQYLHYPQFSCSNPNYEIQKALTSIFQSNKSLFQVAWQYENHLWTHAGVSNCWFREYIFYKIDHSIQDKKDLADFLNTLHQSHPEILATVGPQRKGHAHYGGIFWADKSETENDYLNGYHQYVGHTKVQVILKNERDADSSISFLDCLNSQITFLVTDL